MNTTHKNRTYDLTEITGTPALSADLVRRGFDGTVWMGESLPVGRQRKVVIHAMFYRSKSGEFVCAHKV